MEMDPDDIWRREDEWLAIPSDLSDTGASPDLSNQRAHLWALVLEARHLPCRIEHSVKGCILLVPARSHAVSMVELSLFENENRGWPPPRPITHSVSENTLSTISLLILLATFHNLTSLDIRLFGHYPVDWVAIGNAHAGKILDGQWWRLVTALTLHADWLHLLSNLLLGGLFIVFLCREIGSGLAWSILIASGVIGNLANAFLQNPDHRSVGSSTLVFGAVGILAAISLVRYRSQLQKRWPLPIAAALALLALLGTEGKQTDLGAHLFGFLFGIMLGFAAEYLVEKNGRPGPVINVFLATASSLIVVVAWWVALAYG